MRKATYLQWEHIMLDTTILFSYIQATRESNTDIRCNFVKRLIDDLNTNKSSTDKKRSFYISAISIAEMYDKSTDIKKTEKIVTKLNIANMTFVPFDVDIAEFMTSNYHQVLGTEKQKQISRELDLPESEMELAREWITKDLMIIATADYLKCDAVITLDERTFLPMAHKVDYFCCVAKEHRFNLSKDYIFDYV